MEQVPDAINREIFSYLITCGSQHRYIVNKFTRDYYNDNYKICAPVKALGKTICANCQRLKSTQDLGWQIGDLEVDG